MGSSVQALAVEALYRRHRAALRRFLRRLLGSDDTAAEAAQDAWLRLLRFMPRQGIGDPKAYVFRVAANVARDRIARERSRAAVVDPGPPPEAPACPAPDPEEAAISRHRLRILAAAVDDLPPRCREVFLMSRLDGLSNGEIADRLGISRNMVEKHVIKAMLHCRRRLSES